MHSQHQEKSSRTRTVMVDVTQHLSEIQPHHRVNLFPSFGQLDREQGHWKIAIRGVVFEPFFDAYQDRILVRFLQRAMKADSYSMDSDIFRQRVGVFLAQHGSGIRVAIRIGHKLYRLRRRTKRNGHFSGVLRLSVADVERMRNEGQIHSDWLNFRVVTGEGDQRRITGQAQLIRPKGVSVISDIDDTIKRSDVPIRSELLANTFLREYESIPGMSRLYRKGADNGVAFHYVSSSPWQLYESLKHLCQEDRFPHGTYHLRTLRLKDPRVLSLLLPTRWGKRRTIRSILKAFPRRTFVLIGDSGERDPELYGAIAREYPGRVSRIYIRDLESRSMDSARLRKAFRGQTNNVWRLFTDADQLTTDWEELLGGPDKTTESGF